MKLITIFTAFVFLLNFSSNAQRQLGVRYNLDNPKTSINTPVYLTVKGAKAEIKQATTRSNGWIQTNINDIYTVALTHKMLPIFLNALSNKTSIEYVSNQGHTLADTSLINNNIDSVHQGYLPLTTAYTGKNVIVGIIDDGIYFQHDDFKNADGSTRIRYIWDQNINNTAAAPLPYNYGQEWSWIDIDNGVCNHVEPANTFSHGSNVAGIACGNGLATGHFKGVAPEADIIAVRINRTTNFLPNLLNAVDYIFKKADALGKPCVINTSVGTYVGSHDGLDLTSQAINALLNERNGRALVAASGNGNNINNQNGNFVPTHLQYAVSTDTAFTWFKPDITFQGNNVTYFSLWADTADFNNVNFSIGIDNPVSWQFLGGQDFITIKQDFVGDLASGITQNQLIYDNAVNVIASVEVHVVEIEGRYNIEFLVTPTNSGNYIRFSTFGQGTFDVWSSRNFQGSSDMVFNNLPADSLVPNIAKYQAPDNKKCIVSSWQCSNQVITVGNYVNRGYYFDVDSTFWLVDNVVNADVTSGEIYYQSSEGPTRTNTLKPDIVASGTLTFATANANFVNSALAVNRKKVAPGAKQTYNGGTSMAAPVVAGAVALYLEAHPNASWQEIKEALISTAKKDNFTGANNNPVYGYGKLNGFKLMQFEPIYGCTDSTAFNYNANANVDDGSCEPIILGCTDSLAFNYNPLANTNDSSCIPTIYGCTDSTALNYNPNANVDTGGCEYPTNINSLASLKFKLYPNPTTQQVTIECPQNAHLTLYNALGKIILKKTALKPTEQINVANLGAGIYILNINYNNINVKRKLIIKQ